MRPFSPICVAFCVLLRLILIFYPLLIFESWWILMVRPCRLSTSPRRVPRPRLLAPSTGSIQCRPSARTYGLAALLPNLHDTQQCLQMSYSTPEKDYNPGTTRNDFLLVSCWRAEAEPVTSPRSRLKSEHGDPDKNVTLWVILKSIFEDLKRYIWRFDPCLNYTLCRSRFVLLFHLLTNRFTPSTDGLTSLFLMLCLSWLNVLFILDSLRYKKTKKKYFLTSRIWLLRMLFVEPTIIIILLINSEVDT